ncbi:40S ribosomal protein S6 [Vulpes lagopus]
MKLNISFPATGCQNLIELDDERKLHTFHEKSTVTEVAADGEEWKGYVVQICVGNSKQGFSMKQDVLTHDHIHWILRKGHSHYRSRRTGERKYKSVQGCTMDVNWGVLNLVTRKKREILLDSLILPCKLSDLSKDDVHQYVVEKS